MFTRLLHIHWAMFRRAAYLRQSRGGLVDPRDIVIQVRTVGRAYDFGPDLRWRACLLHRPAGQARPRDDVQPCAPIPSISAASKLHDGSN